MYSDQVPDVNVKKDVIYSFFVRPAAKFTCSPKDMQNAVQVMQDTDIDSLDSGSDLLQGAMITAIVYVSAILIPAGFVLGIAIKCRKHRAMKILPLVTLLSEVAIAITCVILALIARSKYTERSDALKDLDDAVNGCMDTYSDIPDSLVKDQLDQSITDGNNAAYVLIVFGLVVLIKVIVIFTLAVCAVKRSGKNLCDYCTCCC